DGLQAKHSSLQTRSRALSFAHWPELKRNRARGVFNLALTLFGYSEIDRLIEPARRVAKFRQAVRKRDATAFVPSSSTKRCKHLPAHQGSVVRLPNHFQHVARDGAFP